MIYLPYSDDVRQPEADTSFTGLSHPKADAKQLEAAEHLLSKLNLGAFASSDIANPTLQRHYQVGLCHTKQPCSGSSAFVCVLLDMCTSPAICILTDCQCVIDCRAVLQLSHADSPVVNHQSRPCCNY